MSFHAYKRSGTWKGILIIIISLLFLARSIGAAAEYKKKIVIKPLSNISGVINSNDPGSLIAEMLKQSLESTRKYHILNVSLEQELNKSKRHPAQLMIEGQVLVFQPRSNSAKANVKINLVIRDAFTKKIIINKRFLSIASQGQIPFQFPGSPLDMNSLIFRRSALGKALVALIKKATPFINSVLGEVPFEAIIISVDSEKMEVVVNAGKNNEIRVFEPFYVYSVDLNFIDPITKQNLGEKNTRQGIIKVKETLDNYSLAEITVGGDFKAGFIVRSKKEVGKFRNKKGSWLERYAKPAGF